MLNVIKSKWICLGISLVIILAGVVSFFIQGFNLDIDFTGGTTITVGANTPAGTYTQRSA